MAEASGAGWLTLLVGRGRVGRGLLARARGAPGEWRLTSGHRPSRRLIGAARAVVLAVPDPVIAECAARIAPWLGRRACVLHCAGSRDAGELAACREAGAAVAAMHPLASFADPRRPPELGGAAFVTAGDAAAVRAARRIARAVGARVIEAPLHGPAYHALAALIAGGSVGFVHATLPVLVGLGLERREAERAAAALVRTVAGNIATIGLPAALTGPVIRGDTGTVAAHRAALRALSPEVARAYDAVAPLVLACAEEAGLDPELAGRLRALLAGGG